MQTRNLGTFPQSSHRRQRRTHLLVSDKSWAFFAAALSRLCMLRKKKPLGRDDELTARGKGVGQASHHPALRPRLPKNTKNTNTPVGPNSRPCHRAGDHGRPSHEAGHGGSEARP